MIIKKGFGNGQAGFWTVQVRFLLKTDQTAVVLTFSLLICHFIIGGTRNTVRHCMASCLKSCRSGKVAVGLPFGSGVGFRGGAVG